MHFFRTTQFLMSCSDWKQWPSSLIKTPTIGFWGRSNVGKSSLLNALVQGKIAHVSKTPGRTRLINLFFNKNPECLLCDLPGYGYANLSHDEANDIAERIQKYLYSPRAPHLLCWLVDSRHGLTKTDLEMAPMLMELARHRDLLIISTKNDKLSNNEKKKNLTALERQLDDLECDAPIIPFSCHSDAALESLNSVFESFLTSYSQESPQE